MVQWAIGKRQIDRYGARQDACGGATPEAPQPTTDGSAWQNMLLYVARAMTLLSDEGGKHVASLSSALAHPSAVSPPLLCVPCELFDCTD